METGVITLSCGDREGIVKSISDFVFVNKGNILHADQHIDEDMNLLFMRVEWDMDKFLLARDEVAGAFKKIADEFKMDWNIYFSSDVKNTALFVSKHEHCLLDILLRYKAGEFNTKIECVISNHNDCKELVESHGIKYYYIPIDKDNKEEQEEKELKLLKEHNIDLVVLARYMQVLSKGFVGQYKNRVINIHHSFLPAFVGGNPYLRAYERGVKIIGATSHYITENLDQGPIIEQDVARISHRDTICDMRRIGKDLEKQVLARALRWHLENKILVYGLKTVVFD